MPRKLRASGQFVIWGLLFVFVALAVVLAGLEWIAHRPSPVRTTLTATQIAQGNQALRQARLVLSSGSLFKAHPFSPPWTSHSLLVPQGWLRPPGIKYLFGPRHVRADLLLADLNVLQPVMERAYGGWDSAAERGWNWNKWFANWRQQLAAKGTAEIPFSQAFAPIDALMAFQRDNHTQIPLIRWSTIDGSQTAILAGTQSAPCTVIRAGNTTHAISVTDPAQQVRSAKLWRTGTDTLTDTSYIAIPSSFGNPQAVLCGSTWIRLERVKGQTNRGFLYALRAFWSDLRPARPLIKSLGSGIVYARLPSFDGPHYKNFSTAGWPHPLPGDRVLIVDLRNNGGGAEGYGLAILKNWVNEQKMVPFHDLGIQMNTSCLAAPLKWNSMIRGTPRIMPGQKKSLQGLLDQMAQPDPPGCPRTVKTTPTRWSYPQRHFNPQPGQMRIIVLVNSLCASDCELLTERLASLPQTIVAGENTMGVGQFVQPGYAVLPHTGLQFRMALGRSNFYGDNRSYDGYGLNVDIVLPEVNSMGLGQLRNFAEAVEKLPGRAR